MSAQTRFERRRTFASRFFRNMKSREKRPTKTARKPVRLDETAISNEAQIVMKKARLEIGPDLVR